MYPYCRVNLSSAFTLFFQRNLIPHYIPVYFLERVRDTHKLNYVDESQNKKVIDALLLTALHRLLNSSSSAFHLARIIGYQIETRFVATIIDAKEASTSGPDHLVFGAHHSKTFKPDEKIIWDHSRQTVRTHSSANGSLTNKEVFAPRDHRQTWLSNSFARPWQHSQGL